ncbi:hypothetical protein VTK73DRAFT_3058 [Phialemonium thermophilum]|uniref:Uncharacterized protein n=1 Tax=Phialemonium thermophilum TaxID=223376 RepID=A0ABR3X1K6_9PEZI
MGSRNGDQRQLEGVGGATSTTSKVVVVSRSEREDIDVEYTFAQVAVGAEKVDMSGNCGNMASGIAAFALDEGLVKAEPGQTEMPVRIYNTNTNSMLEETIQVDPVTGRFLEEGTYTISGVKGTGSPIKVKFVKPGGSMTTRIFPTGLRQQTLSVSVPPAFDVPQDVRKFEVLVSLIDVANPFVFVDASTLPQAYVLSGGQDSPIALAIVESIRREAAVTMGLAPDAETASLRPGTPKISFLSPASPTLVMDVGELGPTANGPHGAILRQPDINVQAYSMGKVHPSFQLTGAVCLGAAVCLRGTIAAEIVAGRRSHMDTPPKTPSKSPERGLEELEIRAKSDEVAKDKKVVIQHRSGVIDVEVELGPEDAREENEVLGVTVYRTARRLFEGTILVTI